MRKLIEIITLFEGFPARKLYSDRYSNTIKLVAITTIMTMFCHKPGWQIFVEKSLARALRAAPNPGSCGHFWPDFDGSHRHRDNRIRGQKFDKSIALFLVLPSLLGSLASEITLPLQPLAIFFQLI